MHGGAAPQVAAAARRRLSEEAARDLATRRGLGAFPPSGAANVADATRRLSRARKREPRWWEAANRAEDRAHFRAVAAAALRILDADVPRRPTT